MSKIFVFGANPSQMAEAVACAQALGAEAVAFTADEANAQAYAECGAAKVVVLEGAGGIVENCTSQVAQMVADEGMRALVAVACYAGQVLAAGVSAELGWPMVTDVTSVQGDDAKVVASRLMYGGAVSLEEVAEGPVALTVSAGAFEPAVGACSVERVTAQSDGRIEVVSVEGEKKAGVDITKAQRVVGVGMGVRTEEGFDQARALANAIDAEVGGTRGMCEERGKLPDYIGISGLVIQPDLYLSLAVSGQIQHVFGVRGAKVIVACDKNPDAPIFKAADYGFVGDYQEFAAALVSAIA